MRDDVVSALSRNDASHAYAKAHPAILRIRFPAYWHYDLLAGLRTLAAAGAIRDPRAVDALDLLESKRCPDGT